jgi:uncharacterized protein YacL
MMNSMAFIRVFFMGLSILFMTGAAVAQEATMGRALMGSILGVLFGGFLVAFDSYFRKFSLKAFNVTGLGLLFGYFFSFPLVGTLHQITTLTGWVAGTAFAEVGLTLFSLFLGVILAFRAADEITLSIPFVHLKSQKEKKRDLVIDESALHDVRMLDLATSGLLDNSLVMPKFLLKDLHQRSEALEESTRNRSRRCLETLRKLESTPNLNIRFEENDFPEIKDQQSKSVKLARFLEANLLTAEMNRIESASVEGITVINIRRLAESLKPITETGEFIEIKIQRYGKEPRQGVGYLEDGTMVVVNGGGDFIGETIKAQVLSVKHTSSGRMVFCNSADEYGNFSAQLPTQQQASSPYSQAGRVVHQQ